MKTLCIINRVNTPSLEQLDHARCAALHAYRLVAKDWRIVVADGHGIDAEVMKTCLTWSIPLLVCGTSARPKNGVSMRHYQRVVTGSIPLTAKQVERDRYMAQLADKIVYFGPDVHLETLKLGRMPYWLYETEPV